MPEIVRRTFVEEKNLIAEEGDWNPRGLDPEARRWSAYCSFLSSRPVLPLEAEIRAKLPKSLVQVVPAKTPEGLWLRGARYDLEAVLKALKLE
jgi:hypothetical protein